MKIAIIQSCYIPWKGFFDLIGRCDEYVVFDSAQFVKRHWHNRNRIKTANGTDWLTIPVLSRSRYHQPINEVEIERSWADKHWRSIELAYRRAPFFDLISPTVRGWYELADKETRLTAVNLIFLNGLSAWLGLPTRIVEDSEYPSEGVKTTRLLNIASAAGADSYLSGPSARVYLDESVFAAHGIGVEWMDYQGYPAYPQLYGPFDHAVTVLDVLFNTGPDAARYMRPTSS